MLKKPAKEKVQDWHRADIVAAFKKRGTSLYAVSRAMGMYPTYLCAAMDRPYPKAERIIAEFLGLTPQIIWPSRYHLDGTPKSGRGERGIGRHPSRLTAALKLKANDTTARNSRNVKPLNMEKAA